jgi:acyl-coenzyme A thioesterase PaaI-like protein
MTTVAGDGDERASGHILQELGFTVARVGDEVHGEAQVAPEMWVPGTTSLRASILAIWTDVASGHLAISLIAPRVPVTLELDVHVYEQPPGHGTIHAVARTIKAGRSVMVFSVDFTDDEGEPVAVGAGSFMAAPDPGLTISPDILDRAAAPGEQGPLHVPLAERARCERREPGTVVLPRSDDGLNASNTVNGGLVARAIEEAALSLTPGATLSSMAMRYLRALRVGPAVARADVLAGLGRVEVRDAGSDDRLAVVATTRTFPGWG